MTASEHAQRLFLPLLPAAMLISLLAQPCLTAAKQTASPSGAELLARAQQAYDKAPIKSEAGDYTLHGWDKRPGSHESQQNAKASVAVSGDKFDISITWLPAPGPNTNLVPFSDHYAYDGKRFIGRDRLVLTGRQIARVAAPVRRQFTARQYLDPKYGLYYFYKPNKTRVVGKERLNGVECVMVEEVQSHHYKDGGIRTETLRVWIAPSMDYRVQRVRRWVQGELMKPLRAKSLYEDLNLQFRKYDNGLWGPGVVTKDEYRVDARTGERYRNSRMIKTFSADYRLNVPVEIPSVTAESE